MTEPRLTLYAADLAGCCWDERECLDALDALSALENARRDKPAYVWGIYDAEDPERGDVEVELWEYVEELPRRGLGVPL